MRGPKLRRLERVQMEREGEALLVLRDPLELCDPIAVDADYAPVLDALDGQRTLAQIRQSLLMRGIVRVELEDLEEFVAELRASAMLDDEVFRARWQATHLEFVESERRSPRRAGLLYPADPSELRAWLTPALPLPVEAPPSSHTSEPSSAGGEAPIALILPHQPPPRVGRGLRKLLSQLPDPSHYRRVVLLATDHAPGLLPHASADKDWETPLGDLGCDLELLAQLDQRLPWLLREQIRLRTSDVVEWSTLILRALWGDRCPPILPIVCAQTRLTTPDGAERGELLSATLDELVGDATRAGEVLWWTAAELSHAGPAYGDQDQVSASQIEALDRDLLDPLLSGQPDRLAKHCMDRPVRQRPSGTAALATLARALPSSYRAELIDYEALPASGEAPGWIGCAHVCVRRGL